MHQEHIQTLLILGSIFTGMFALLTTAIGCLVWVMRRLVIQLETMHTKTIPAIVSESAAACNSHREVCMQGQDVILGGIAELKELVKPAMVLLIALGAGLLTPPLQAQEHRKLSPNFAVGCDNAIDAANVAGWAERYRRAWALEWLGKELPAWPERCPVHVRMIDPNAADKLGGGATSFAFDGGRVLARHMKVFGEGQHLCCDVVPHEVTHTIFADYFRRPVPRWADEGGAILSESASSRQRHGRIFDECRGRGLTMPLASLLALDDYPDDNTDDGRHIMTFYSQSYSVSNYLVARHGRRAFLRLIDDGLAGGWDAAVRRLGYAGITDLEAKWKQSLRPLRPAAPIAQAGMLSRPAPARGTVAFPGGRESMAPMQPAPRGGGWSQRPAAFPCGT